MAQDRFVKDYSLKVTALLVAFEDLRGIATQYVAGDLGNVITDADCTPLGFTAAQFVAGVGSVATLEATGSAGHYTNLYKLKQG